jgi:centromeric protein E
VSEDALSSSDTYDALYEEQDDLGSNAFDVSHVCNGHLYDPELPKTRIEPYQQIVDEQPMSSLHQPRHHISDSIQIYQPNREASLEVSKEHCKEVQCIQTNELRRSQLFFHADRSHAGTNIDEEKHGENITDTSDCAIKLYTCDSDPSSDSEKTNTDESLALKRCVISSRDNVLTRSKSCRASFMVIPNSWFDGSMDVRMTPPGDIFKYAHRRPEKVRRSLYHENSHCQNDPTLDCPVVSGTVASNTVIDKNTCNEEDEDTINNVSCITKVKEKSEECCTSQPEGNEVQVASL